MNDKGNKLAPIILAAGRGSRMLSTKSKLFHEIGGRPLIHYILDMVKVLEVPSTYIVVGKQSDLRAGYRGEGPVHFVEQAQPLGTGHAVLQVAPYLKDFPGNVLILNGDVPLITAETVEELLGMHVESNAVATVLTAVVDDPTGYGRIIRGAHGTITRIVEQKDGTVEELKVREINTGIYCFQAQALFSSLQEITPTNVQKEYYLTDTISILKSRRLSVLACRADDSTEVIGINSRQDLAIAEKVLQRRTVKRLMKEGVTIVDPEVTYIDPVVTIGRDTVIYPFTFIKGKTTVGDGCHIGPNAHVDASTIADGVVVRQADVYQSKISPRARVLHAVLEGATVAEGETVGPFQTVRSDKEAVCCES